MNTLKAKGELVEALTQVHNAIDPYEPVDTAYDAHYVATYLGVIIDGVNEDEVAEIDDADQLEMIDAIRVNFPDTVAAFAKATNEWFVMYDDVERASHVYAIAIIDLLDALK